MARAAAIVEEVQAAVKRWSEFAEAARLPAVDSERIQAAFRRILAAA